MTDPFLFFIICLQMLIIIWLLYREGKERLDLLSAHKQDRDKLVNALVAKHPAELRDLTLADKVAPIVPQAQQEPDLVPESSLSDEDFDQAIRRQLETQPEPST